MSFASLVGQWSEDSKKKLNVAFQKISLDAFTNVILMSPVDTGRFRGNWQVGIGSIPASDVDKLYVDPSGAAILSDIQQAVLDMKFGDTIYLVNNLPYARRLEYGWSQQAPNGMVRVTVAQFQPIVNAVVAEVKASN